MTSVQISPALVEYLAARGVSLDATEEQPETEEAYEPTAEDEADYRAWCAEVDARDQDLEDIYRESQYQDMLERAEYERTYDSWVIRPV